jgi:hypothetical protein
MLYCVSVHSLNAKELFNVSLGYPSSDFDYRGIKTVSFFISGDKEIDIDRIVKSLAKGKAEVIITGETSIEGEALSPNLAAHIIVHKKAQEKSWLVSIDTSVSGEAKAFRGPISISGQVLVFVDSTDPKEVERAISANLEGLIKKVTSACSTKPKFFVVH